MFPIETRSVCYFSLCCPFSSWPPKQGLLLMFFSYVRPKSEQFVFTGLFFFRGPILYT